jgi:hypothetical protein
MRYRLLAISICLLASLTLAAAALATVVQEGTLRVSIATQVKPFKLPRTEPAPIDVFIAGHISTTTGALPPQLEQMTVLINRHGEIDPTAVPACPLVAIRPSTTAQALARCGSALVGSGHFWASVVVSEQRPYHTTGRLLVFNGRLHGQPALLAQIYTSQPFPSSFVVPFTIRHIDGGRYGTELSAQLSQSLGEWGFVNRIKMTIGRSAEASGSERSYLNAACPAPGKSKTTAFPLALATFGFAGGQSLSATVSKSCGVKE